MYKSKHCLIFIYLEAGTSYNNHSWQCLIKKFSSERSVCSLGWAVSKRWSREKDCEFTRMCVMWSGSDGMKQAWHGRETSARIVRVEVWDSIGSKESRCGWMATWIQSTTVWKLWREPVRDNIPLQAIQKTQKCLAIINDTVLPFWPKFPSVIIRLFWPL